MLNVVEYLYRNLNERDCNMELLDLFLDNLVEIFVFIKDFFVSLFSDITGEQVALISVIVTLITFYVERRKSYKLKVYEIRKEQYSHLLELLKKVFSSSKGTTSEQFSEKIKIEDFYDVGASLAIYGSKKLYKQYCFYREISINEHLQKTKYFNKEMVIFVIGEMYQTMRKEIGLNNELIKVDVPDALSFMINDTNKPEYRKKYYKYVSNKVALKTLIFFGKLDSGLPFHYIYNCLLVSLFRCIYMPIHLLVKHLIILPAKKIYRFIKLKK